MALASCLNKFAWNARGTSFADKVSAENYQVFGERVKEAEKILWSVQGEKTAYYSVLKQGFLDMRKAYGVTERDKSWIFHKAIATKDKAFALQLYGELKNKADLPLRVDKELFDAAVKEFEKTKP